MMMSQVTLRLANNKPINLWHEIAFAIIEYLDDLSDDWFGGAQKLKDNFTKWKCFHPEQPVNTSPTKEAKVDTVMLKRQHNESFRNYQKRTEAVRQERICLEDRC